VVVGEGSSDDGASASARGMAIAINGVTRYDQK
jgi:hypothetical protein